MNLILLNQQIPNHPYGAGPTRGGSWNNNRRNARCAYRNDNHPDNFNNNVGFRVVFHDSRRRSVQGR